MLSDMTSPIVQGGREKKRKSGLVIRMFFVSIVCNNKMNMTIGIIGVVGAVILTLLVSVAVWYIFRTKLTQSSAYIVIVFLSALLAVISWEMSQRTSVYSLYSFFIAPVFIPVFLTYPAPDSMSGFYIVVIIQSLLFGFLGRYIWSYMKSRTISKTREADQATQSTGLRILKIICGAIGGGIALSLVSAPIMLITFGFFVDGHEAGVNTISVLIFVAGLVVGGIAAAKAKRIWILGLSLAIIGIVGIVILKILL